MRSTLFATSLCALLATACAQKSPKSPAKEPRSEASSSEPKASELSPEKSEQRPLLEMPKGSLVSFEKELAHVAKLRGLQPKSQPHGLIVETSELIGHVERTLELERPEASMSGTGAMLIALGVVPQGFDFRKTMLQVLASNLAGLYEPRLEAMLVRKGLGVIETQGTLMHELVHALQDQYYDLSEIVEFRPDDSDISSAISCLAEGDATSAMFDALLPEGKTALSVPFSVIEQQFQLQQAKEADDAIPPVIRRSLIAPYLDGLRFVHHLRTRGGWAEVDRVWAAPPQSTEQILHLEKYDAKEAPLSVPVPPGPSPEWTLILHDIWGEQTLRLLLEEWGSKEIATAAAAGWGGDRIASYKKENRLAVSWKVAFDSEQDAKEMLSLAEAALSKKDSSDSCQRVRLDGNTVHLVGLAGSGSEDLCIAAEQWLSSSPKN